MKINSHFVSCTLAILMHILLIAIVVAVVLPKSSVYKNNKIIGWRKTPIIQSYLFEPKQKKNIKSHKQQKASVQKLKSYTKSDHPIKKASDSFKKYQSKSIKAAEFRANLTHGQYDALLIKLHNQIEKQQQYPIQAERLSITGRVMVGFVLLPKGLVKQLKIVKSSGYQILDQSALSAVKAASPFKNIHIEHAQHFVLKIVY